MRGRSMSNKSVCVDNTMQICAVKLQLTYNKVGCN